MSEFWDQVDAALGRVEKATTVDEVIEILKESFDTSAGDAFFPGSGGDRQLLDALYEAPNWRLIWAEAEYYYVASDQAGNLLTYIEGDVYRGDRR